MLSQIILNFPNISDSVFGIVTHLAYYIHINFGFNQPIYYMSSSARQSWNFVVANLAISSTYPRFHFLVAIATKPPDLSSTDVIIAYHN